MKEVHYYARYHSPFVVRVGKVAKNTDVFLFLFSADNEKEEIHLHCDHSFHERFKQRDVNVLFSCKPW